MSYAKLFKLLAPFMGTGGPVALHKQGRSHARDRGLCPHAGEGLAVEVGSA